MVDTTLPTQTRGPGGTNDESGASAPERIDRYEVGRVLGSGGMGTVYEAYDPKLKRAVALKLLHRDVDADSNAGKRLLREARALGRVSHPHVVEVFGVGVDTGQVWLAMELVRGQTLQQWIAQEGDASLERRLEVLSQAGRGLGAAHAEGLTHRDFKPANVLVGDDGRVRVVDFGIAQAGSSRGGAPVDTTLEERMTQTGRAVGTPRYMAPEQRRGGEVGPYSDQFSFAVTAWEVLHGERPFAGETLDALLLAVDRGAIEKPKNEEVPSWINGALRRGLRARSRKRHGSMEGLLAALEPTSRRRRWWWLGGAGVMSVAVVGALNFSAEPSYPLDCDRLAQERFAAHWGHDRRQRVHVALLETGTAYSERAPAVLDAEIEAYQRAWSDGFVAACQTMGPAEVGGEEAGALSCHRQRLDELDQVLDRLEVADVSLVERVSSTVRALPSPRTCGVDRAADDERAKAQELSGQLATARTAFVVREYDEALELAEMVAAEAAATNETAVHGDALALIGEVYFIRDDVRMQEVVEAAYMIAAGGGAELHAAQRARRLSIFHGRGGATDVAQRWHRQQATHLLRAGVDPDGDPDFLHDRCRLLDQQGQHELAVNACMRSIDAFSSVPGATEIAMWGPRAMLATQYVATGRSDDARRLDEQLLIEAETMLGPQHPRVGGMHLNLGSRAYERNQNDLAIQHAMKARAVFEAAYGPDYRWVVSSFLNEGLYLRAKQDHAEAAKAYLEGLSRLGDKNPAQRARLLNNLAEVRRIQGHTKEALELLLEVQRVEEETLRSGHPQTAHTAQALCNAYADAQRPERALVECRRAVQIRRTNGARMKLAASLRSLGALLVHIGRVDEGCIQFETAIKALGTGEQERMESMWTRARLADAHLVEGNVEAAREQLDAIEALDLQGFELDDEMRGWNAFVRARLALADGDRAQAAKLGHEAEEFLREVPRMFPWPPDVESWLVENGLEGTL